MTSSDGAHSEIQPVKDCEMTSSVQKSKPETKPLSTSLLVTPALRVEELRDDGHSSASCISEEEGGLSHGEASDQGEDNGPPDENQQELIKKQVEFYFSDANILHDTFLLKHVRRNKQGYVSLKLITSFRRIKKLAKDYRYVAASLSSSQTLEVNEDGTKVRRLAPLPDYDETTPSRTIVAVNLPLETPTIENVADLFKHCGEISLVRILRPGKPLPPDVKRHVNKHPELGNTVCAVVEFEHHESAKNACDTMTNDDDWRKGLRIVLLSHPRKPGKNKKQKEENCNSEGDVSDSGDRQKKKPKKKGRVNELSADKDSSYCSSGSESDYTAESANRTGRSDNPSRKSLSPHPERDFNHLTPTSTPKTTPRSSPRSSPRTTPKNSPNFRRRTQGKSPLVTDSLSPGQSPRPSPCGSPEARRKNSTGTGSSPSSPWVQRRLRGNEGSPINGSPAASPRLGRRLPDGSLPDGIKPRMANMEGVVRQPRGPDGTRGFTSVRGSEKTEETES